MQDSNEPSIIDVIIKLEHISGQLEGMERANVSNETDINNLYSRTNTHSKQLSILESHVKHIDNTNNRDWDNAVSMIAIVISMGALLVNLFGPLLH